MMFVFTKSASLQSGLFTKEALPRLQGRTAPVKDEVVSLLPNLPSSNDERSPHLGPVCHKLKQTGQLLRWLLKSWLLRK